MKSRLYLLVVLLAFGCDAATTPFASAQTRPSPLPPLEWTGADEAPAELSWQTTIPPADEPGEPLILSGTVYQPDGKTPAAGVIVYAYHTNQRGIYPKRGAETGNGRRHGYLRGWVRTDEQGRYQFTTLRPAAYPSRTEAAHIHMTVKPPEGKEYWLPTVFFEGDPLLSEEDSASGSVICLERDDEGTWRARHDVTLR